MGHKFISVGLWVIVFFLFLSFVNAESSINVYPVSDSPQIDVSTGQNSEWFYLRISDGSNQNYIGINKISRGIMGVGDSTEFFGEVWFVPAFKHPVNSEWYLCPIRDISTIYEVRDLGNGWWFNISDSATMCYQYSNPATTANANLDFQISFSAIGNSVKININTTVNGVSPSNTGFAFIFFPENPAKYRYIMLNGIIYDIAGVEGTLPADKVFEFLDSGQEPIGHTFDWTDMLDTGNRYSEILTVGGKKGLMVGTYGYGASNKIEIDPTYNISLNATAPSYYLEDGDFVRNISIYDYKNQSIIQDELSDGDEGTAWDVRLGELLLTQDLNYYFVFNSINGEIYARDMSANNDYLTLLSSADFGAGINLNTLKADNVATGGAKGIYESFYNIGMTDYTYCLKLNSTKQVVGTDYLLNHKYGFAVNAPHYSLGVKSTQYPVCYSRDNNDTGFTIVQVTANVNVSDGQPHTVCCRRDISEAIIEILVDGISYQNNTGTQDYIISNYGDLVVSNGITGYDGMIDDLILLEHYMTTEEMDYFMNYGNYNVSLGRALQPNFNRVINTSRSYSLVVHVTDLGWNRVPLRVYPMINTTHINDSIYAETMVADGDNYVNINPILYNGYNAPFRLSTIYPKNLTISDIYLFEVGDDTSPPTIKNCVVNDTLIDCNESVTWQCEIEDDVHVYESWFKFGFGGIFNISQKAINLGGNLWGTQWSSDDMELLLDSYNWSFNDVLNISNIYINATDLSDNNAENYTSEPSSIYNCIMCFPDWVAQYGSCLTNDSMLKYYVDNNSCDTISGLPADNGTYVGCNYCTADPYKEYTTECFHNGSYYVINYTWADNNYWSCCVLTGLPSDCPTHYSPYNVSGQEYCTFTENDFDIDYDSEVYFGLTDDKVYWKFNLNDTNNTYKCISYIKTTSGNLLQINPQHALKTSTLIQFTGSEFEDREYFQTHNGIGNVYFKKENLIIDGRVYIFGVECSGNTQTLKSERLVTVLYENVNTPITRWFWVRENAVSLFLGFLVLIFLILFVAWAIYRLRRG